MKVNDIIHGFKIERKRAVSELSGTLYEMRHIKTGAELAFLDNGEENKLFSVAFKTLPWDDTGVFHILEHSVLAGSDNYPVKEPFLDLLKSSMNTFLNAMTFPDKTLYPVSSKNEQDFINLTRVYLDAVFRPAIYYNENIFRQEGWHYEVEDGKPFYNGVVFNEMKGALSSVDGQIAFKLMKTLFPNTVYGYEFGGDPKVIPDLTYENFLNAHREFYSPTNAKLYLDGSVPLERTLKIIDEEYLSSFEFSNKTHEIAIQKPIEQCDVTDYYEIGREEDEKNKTQFLFGKVFADWSERERITKYRLVFSYLAATNESPLCRAILEKGLAQNVELEISDREGLAQIYYSILFRNTEPENKEKIKEVYIETINNILEKGIDREEMTACLNKLEFSMRELDEPKGLERNIMALSSWLYGGDMLLYLENEELLKKIRGELDKNCFEDIFRELLDFSSTAFITMVPSKTKGEEDRAAEKERVNSEYFAMSSEEQKKVSETFENLRKWQDTPDTSEAQATLPKLSLSDVDRKPQRIPTEIKEGVLFHKLHSNGIVYGTLYFNINDKSLDELSKLSALSELFGLLPTKNKTSAELQKEIRKNIGALTFTVEALSVESDLRVHLVVSFSVLEERLEQALELLREILLETDFSKRDIIKENFLQAEEGMYQSIIGMGHQYATRKALSHSSPLHAVTEKTDGFDFFKKLKNFNENFDSSVDDFIAFSSASAKDIFVKERLVISETASSHHPVLASFYDVLPSGTSAPEVMTLALDDEPVKEAILIPAGVSYAAYCSNIRKFGFEYQPKLTVLATLLTYGYLWNEIRVYGGAYGCGFRATLSGSISFHSFRDPNPLNSIEVYKNTGDFIKSFVEGDEEIDKYIISSISRLDGLLPVLKQGITADAEYFSKITYDFSVWRREEMLNLKKEELLSLLDLFEKMKSENSICIIGNEEALSSLDSKWLINRL